jgi:hypothetical protein
MSSETDLSRNQAIQNQRNSFSRGFPLPFNVETLQAFGALFQIPQYYRKFLYYKTKMLCNYVINTRFCIFFFYIYIFLVHPRITFPVKLSYMLVKICTMADKKF